MDVIFLSTVICGSQTPLLIDSSCLWNQFACSKNKCIAKQWLCDGEDDCGDGVDESVDLCGTHVTSPSILCNCKYCFFGASKAVLNDLSLQCNYYKLGNYENAIML